MMAANRGVRFARGDELCAHVALWAVSDNCREPARMHKDIELMVANGGVHAVRGIALGVVFGAALGRWDVN